MKSNFELTKEKISYYIHDDIGILEISGEDRIDFIQRQSTNDISKINNKNIITTVLTTPNARIIDVLTLIQIEDSLFCISLPGHRISTYEFLKSKIFFMDKVEINDVSEDFFRIDIEGNRASAMIKSLGFENPKLDEHISQSYDNNLLIIGGQKGLVSENGYIFLMKSEVKKNLIKKLNDNEVDVLDWETREIFRVVGSIPGPQSELNNEYTPLENNLDWAISNSKGCYTGQEIIARQINYDKITKRLAKIQFEKMVDNQSKVFFDGKNIGKVTSIINAPDQGVIALAILKRPYFEIGTEIYVQMQDKKVNGKVLN